MAAGRRVELVAASIARVAGRLACARPVRGWSSAAGRRWKRCSALVKETGAGAVFWNRRYEPAVIARDAKVKEALARATDWRSRASTPRCCTSRGRFRTRAASRSRSSRRSGNIASPSPIRPSRCRAPKNLPAPAKWPKSLALDELELEPKINWADGLRAAWQPGEAGADAQLKRFSDQGRSPITPTSATVPTVTGTSRLSPHLHFGEISPRQIWHGAAAACAAKRGLPDRTVAGVAVPRRGRLARVRASSAVSTSRTRPTEPLRADFKQFPWRKDAAWLKAWQKGPHRLSHRGRRHARVVGDGLDAQSRADDCGVVSRERPAALVAGRRARGSGTRSWTPTSRRTRSAGNGPPAAARMPRPISACSIRSARARSLIRTATTSARWCPELAKLPDAWLHQPWQAPPEILRARRGRTRPRLIPNPSSVTPSPAKSRWRRSRESKASARWFNHES